MSNQISIRRRLGVAIAASAVALTLLAQSASADPPQGTCKFRFEHAVATSALAAQQLWIAQVQSKFGSKWAQWAGAKNKTIVAVSGGNYQAAAKPCFYQPVL